MKNSFVWAIAVSLLIGIILMYSLKNFKGTVSIETGGSSIEFPQSDTSFGGLLHIPTVSDTISHYLYKKINDSIQNVKKSLTFEGNRIGYGGFGVGFLGISELKKTYQNKKLKIFVDSLNLLQNLISFSKDSNHLASVQQKIDRLKANFNNGSSSENQDITYCISLRKYKLEDNAIFFIQNDGYHLAYVVWDSVKQNSNNNLLHGSYARKQIPVLYSQNEKTVYIPVTKSTYKIVGIILNIWGFLLITYSILVLLILPVFILISISGGRVFTSRNILGLKIIAYSLLFFTILKISEPFLLHSVFKAKIPIEMKQMSFREILNDSLPFVVITAVVLLIWKAFQKGYKLQQEQDLTI